jgi:hypothetical protein
LGFPPRRCAACGKNPKGLVVAWELPAADAVNVIAPWVFTAGTFDDPAFDLFFSGDNGLRQMTTTPQDRKSTR